MSTARSPPAESTEGGQLARRGMAFTDTDRVVLIALFVVLLVERAVKICRRHVRRTHLAASTEEEERGLVADGASVGDAPTTTPPGQA